MFFSYFSVELTKNKIKKFLLKKWVFATNSDFLTK